MGTLRDIKQKIEGEADEVKGKMQQQSGHGVKGGMTQVKGKLKKAFADTKLKAREGKQKEEIE